MKPIDFSSDMRGIDTIEKIIQDQKLIYVLTDRHRFFFEPWPQITIQDNTIYLYGIPFVKPSVVAVYDRVLVFTDEETQWLHLRFLREQMNYIKFQICEVHTQDKNSTIRIER